MTNLNTDAIIQACDTLASRLAPHEGCYTSSCRFFDACMRAFDNKRLPAQAVKFRVFYNAPVMKLGTATIDREGNLVCRIDEQ